MVERARSRWPEILRGGQHFGKILCCCVRITAAVATLWLPDDVTQMSGPPRPVVTDPIQNCCQLGGTSKRLNCNLAKKCAIN